jgi:NADH dehydrogenase FAD-containing subunit
MPRYHFHIIDGVKVFDPKGMALPDAQAARQHAKIAARAFRRNLSTDEFKVRVTDERGHVIYEAMPEEES